MSDRQAIHLEPVTLEFVQGLKGRVPLGFFKVPENAGDEYFDALARFIRVAAEAVSEADAGDPHES